MNLDNLTQMLFGPPQGGAGLAGDPMFQVGLSLLSSGSPSFNMNRDNSFGGAISQGFQNAGDIQSQGIVNEARRQAVLDSKQARADQMAMQEAMSQPGADFDAIAKRYMPEAYIKAKLGAALDPETRLRLLDLEERIGARQRDATSAEAEKTTPAGAAVRSIDNVVESIDKFPENPFGPGGMFHEASPLGKAGLNAENIALVPDVVLNKFGDPNEIREKAAAASTISKELTALGSATRAFGAAGGGQSATAINNMNKQLATGNVQPSVVVKVTKGTLETIRDDLLANNIAVPPELDATLERLTQLDKKLKTPKGQETSTPKVDALPPRRRKPNPKKAPSNQNIPMSNMRPQLDYMPSSEEAAAMKAQGVTSFKFGGKTYGIR